MQGLADTMAETGSDFTDTFRILADITPKMNSPDQSFQEALDKLVQICAPMALLDKKSTSKFSPQELAQLENILENKPEILPLLGIDPDMARQEVEKAKQARSCSINEASKGKK